MSKIISQFNYPKDLYKGQDNFSQNLCVPDNSKTLRELYAKYSIGSSDSSYREGYYDDDNAPFDAPLAPNRMGYTDPVDVQTHIDDVVKPYIDSVESVSKSKIEDYKTKNKRRDNDSNDDATNNRSTDDSISDDNGKTKS